MSKDSIALIGFMATGKTTIGKALAKRLGNNYKFIEMDQLIIQEVGKSISKIFDEEGEAKFREYEISVCEKVSKLKKVVISCGGGVVINPENIENLRKNCYVILLTASIEEIYKRIIKDGKKSRPLIKKEDSLEEMKKLLIERQSLYKSAADLVIDTSEKQINRIVDMILVFYNQVKV
ncbi:MAG: shikimate kinase [Candidatus Lokiarchaeia archaeon]|nr:shikimate kinase [Candidatus Lokiarchaeia archaeon]